MDGIDWKMMQVGTILGIPRLDSKYLPAHVIVTLKTKISEVPGIGAIILYGSIVRGEASPKSDVDVMIVPMINEDTTLLKNEITKILRDLENEYKLTISFSPVIFTGEEDSYFIWEVVKDGVVIFIKPELVLSPDKNITPYALISYSLSGLDNSQKKKIQRFLFKSKDGVKIDMKNKLEYIAPSVLLISIEKANQLTSYFDSNNVNYSLIKVWR